MYGDSLELLDHAKGGNDTLISGPGNDQMWGDAATVAPTGADTFVFSLARINAPSPAIGHDQIMDFQPGQDHIELQGFSQVTNFDQVASHTTDTAQGSLITIDANNSILVTNDHNLTSGDFFFT
jgi:Ca2+-binding RTX toxin-like protein